MSETTVARMKTTISVLLLVGLAVVQAKLECDDYFGCVNKVLREGEPITVAELMPHFTLMKVSGVIDNSTFSELPHLESLYIEYSDIYRIEKHSLCANFRNLQKLQITFNSGNLNVTKDVLGNCYNLKSLSISGHFIEDNALENLPELEQLYLDDTNVPRSVCTSNRLKTLIIEEITEDRLSEYQLRFCTGIEEINIATVVGMDDDIFGRMQNLKSISMYKVQLPHLRTKLFSQLPFLEFLELDDCGIKQIDGEAFDGLINLKYLTVTFAEADITFRHLYYMQKLVELTLKQPIRIPELHAIALPGLEYLNVESEDLALVDLWTIRRNNPKLRKLVFFGNDNICNDVRLVRSLVGRSGPTFEIQVENGLAHTGFC